VPALRPRFRSRARSRTQGRLDARAPGRLHPCARGLLLGGNRRRRGGDEPGKRVPAARTARCRRVGRRSRVAAGVGSPVRGHVARGSRPAREGETGDPRRSGRRPFRQAGQRRIVDAGPPPRPSGRQRRAPETGVLV
ncbi:MAG: hypothetical protein AVDCRST_MAG91-2089, partial [uncultured Sphingomonadaceae bacterium]